MALVALAAYFNSLAGAFVFDDDSAILTNSSIRHLRPLASVLNGPPGGSPATGRPFTNLTFALNFAAGGISPSSYHVLNLVIHGCAALLLFGIVRRTLENPRSGAGAWFAHRSAAIAAACAALWVAHPLQTESVTYVAQRSEELMGLCFLGALYGLVRAGGSSARASHLGWLWTSATCCALGMTAKEVMATAPLILLLYDRTFISGGLLAALQKRRAYYLGLAASWIPLALLLSRSGSRGGTIGFGAGITGWRYLVSQCTALAHYVGLVFWPHPLVIDYGGGALPLGRSFAIGMGLAVLGLWWTVAGLMKKTPAGFLGFWFFAILAPTSSIIPVASETMAEHRLYLPLAALVVALVVILCQLARAAAWPVLLVLVGLAVAVTRSRNEDYRSPLSLWAQTVAAEPANAGAHNNLGAAMLAAQKPSEAEVEFRAALRLDPTLAGARNNLGSILLQEGRYGAAVVEFADAIRIAPTYPEARVGLADALAGGGRPDEALDQYDQALALGANPTLVRRGRSLALLQSGRQSDAVHYFRETVAADPTSAAGHVDLGFGLERSGDLKGSEAEYREALRLDPASGDAAFNLGNLLAHRGRLAEAIPLLRAAIRAEPERAEAYGNLGGALIAAGRPAEAVEPCEHALHLRPDLVEARLNLGNALAQLGQYPAAIAAYRALLKDHPEYPLAHHNLAAALHATGDDDGARAELTAERQARAASR